MKILIGGGAGYIGTELCKKLLTLGYDITVIDLCWFGNNLPIEISIIKKDLLDCTISDLEGYEQFIFLAGLSNDPMADFSPKLNYLSNGAMPSYLAYICKQAGIKRFIYASSCSIYGHTNNNTIIHEDNDKLTNFPYGISKYQGEIGVNNIRDSNFSTVCLRMGTVGGYSDRLRFDVVLNAMFKSAYSTGVITINNPYIWRPILDIRDAVQAYVDTIKCTYSISGEFNITSENITLQELGCRIKNTMSKLMEKEITLNILNIKDKRSYFVDISKAERLLKFKPVYKVEDSIEGIYRNMSKINVEDKKHININIFKQIMENNTS